MRIMELKFKYKTMVKPVAYVNETRTMREKYMKSLTTWKRNMLKRIY